MEALDISYAMIVISRNLEKLRCNQSKTNISLFKGYGRDIKVTKTSTSTQTGMICTYSNNFISRKSRSETAVPISATEGEVATVSEKP